MWELEVPKVAHFYWGGGKLIYMRYLTITTFIKYNPDWQVIFWYPKNHNKNRVWGVEPGNDSINEKLCKDYFPNVMSLPITKQSIDFFSLGMTDNTAEVHKNDYIRINVLNLYGGIWSDMDIIYFKPLDQLKANNKENKNKEVFVCISDYGHSTGFNMAIKESRFYSKLNEMLKYEYKPYEYQCWGPDIYNKFFKTMNSIPGGFNLSMDVVYAHDCHHVKELFGKKSKFTDESIGCHWYGGNSIWGRFINETRGGEV